MRWDRLWNVHRQWMSRSSDGRLFHTVGPAETKKRVLQVSSWFWLWLQTSNFEVKVKHFRVLMSCIVSAASYCTAIDLSCDGTNHTISYMLYSWLCMSWGGSNTLMDHIYRSNIGGSGPLWLLRLWCHYVSELELSWCSISIGLYRQVGGQTIIIIILAIRERELFVVCVRSATSETDIGVNNYVARVYFSPPNIYVDVGIRYRSIRLRRPINPASGM